MADQDIAPLSLTVERDLRLDLFRGIGLWMIFLDHIPDDFVSWLTLRNYGFSDAAEFFVFIFRLSGRLYLWSDHTRREISGGRQAAVDARLADVRGPHHAISAVHRADRAHRQEI
jgi:hypothetical protein